MPIKKSSSIIFVPAVFSAVFLFINNVSAIGFDPNSTPHLVCQEYRSQSGYTVVRDTANDCLVRTGSGKEYVSSHFYISGSNFCFEMTSSSMGRISGQCVPMTGQQKTQLTDPVKIKPTVPVEAKTVKKGVYYKNDLSKELVALFDPADRTNPQIYTYSLDTMGGFPPMGLILKPNGVLEGTPTGKDSEFRACATNLSGKKVCKIINVDVEKEKTDKLELTSSEPFKLTEWAYEGLTLGQQMQSGNNERVDIRMPDGSLIEMDKYSTLTPISEFEVKSDEGRFRFDYQKANGGGCGPIGQSPTWACRQVDTRDATLRVKGTEFLVDTDKFGTNITVLEGLLSVSDAKGKKTIEIAGGQYTYIKKGALPAEPQSFDSSQVDRWWEAKTPAQMNKMILGIIGGFFIFIILLSFVGKMLRKKKAEPKIEAVRGEKNPAITATPAMVEKKEIIEKSNREELAVISFIIGITSVVSLLNFYFKFWLAPPAILNFLLSPAFLIVEIFGLVLGMIGFKASKKSFATFVIILNIVGIVLWGMIAS